MAGDRTPWLSAREAARYMKVSMGTLLREARAGRIRVAKVGGRRALRIKREWCDEALEMWSVPIEVLRR